MLTFLFVFTSSSSLGAARPPTARWALPARRRLDATGNTLITEGSDGRTFEVTADKQIVWEFIAPWVAPPGSGFGNAVYRAYRVPRQWLPQTSTCP